MGNFVILKHPVTILIPCTNFKVDCDTLLLCRALKNFRINVITKSSKCSLLSIQGSVSVNRDFWALPLVGPAGENLLPDTIALQHLNTRLYTKSPFSPMTTSLLATTESLANKSTPSNINWNCFCKTVYEILWWQPEVFY